MVAPGGKLPDRLDVAAGSWHDEETYLQRNQARPCHAPPPGGTLRNWSVQGRGWKNGEHASDLARVRVMPSRDRREGVGCESRSTAPPGKLPAAPTFWKLVPTAFCSIAACSIPSESTPTVQIA